MIFTLKCPPRRQSESIVKNVANMVIASEKQGSMYPTHDTRGNPKDPLLKEGKSHHDGSREKERQHSFRKVRCRWVVKYYPSALAS